jgi:hypothetical protein
MDELLLYSKNDIDKMILSERDFWKDAIASYKKCPIFILKSGAGEIFASFDHEPNDEEMDIEYAKYLKEDSLPSGTASWNCVLYRIFVGDKLESWNGPYTGSKYNWITRHQ